MNNVAINVCHQCKFIQINLLNPNDNSSIERVEEFKYLGTTLTHQNSIQEEIKSRLKSGNACYYSVQNLLASSLLSKKLKLNYNIARCSVWV